MSDAEHLPAALRARFRLLRRYAGGEGLTMAVLPRDGGGAQLLKVLPAGVEPAEASLLLSLRHPAIPAVHEVGRLPDGRAFVLREHVEGEVLRTLPREPGALRESLQELLEVLAYVHLRGVAHLDLKPGNLLRGSDGRLRLLDFGLGARSGQAGRGGTPFFAAPEQWLGLAADARADLFAVGAMVAQALWPGDGPDVARFVAAFPAQDFFVAAGLDARSLPAPFDRFVARCTARQPAERFADAQAALEFLGGGSGRPSASLLHPDAVLLWSSELARAVVAAGSVVVRGGAPADRRALALHLVASLPGVRAVREDADAVHVLRNSGEAAFELDLPPLDADRLLPHLDRAFGLSGEAATSAARWLARRGATGTEAVARSLLALVDAGEIVPSGMRWTWPAARSGRLAAAGDAMPAAPATVDELGRAAASGRAELAFAGWRRIAAEHPADEPAARAALVAGLLDGGEPARALPLCADLPGLRAQALLDTGRMAEAADALASMPDPTATPRLRRTGAQLAAARGDLAAALAQLHDDGVDVLESLTRAAVLEQAGRAADAHAVLAAAAPVLARGELPFAEASAATVHGHLARAAGDLQAARSHFEHAARTLFALGNVRHAASALLNLGVVAKDLGEHALAVERLREARTLYQHVGDAVRAAIAAANLGSASLARNDAAAARQWLDAAAAELARLGERPAAALATAMLARAHAQLGDADAASAALARVGDATSARLRDEVARVHELLRGPLPAAPPPMTERPPSGPSRELFRTFLAVNRQLAQEVDLDKAMRHLLDAAVTLTAGRIGYLLVAHDDGMRREFQSGDAGPIGQAFSRSLAHRAMQLQRTLTGADGLADRDLQDMPSIRNLQVRSAICAPFRSAGGVVGAIYVEHPGRAGAFTDVDKEALEVLADQAAIAVDRMLREQAVLKELTASQRELAVAKRSSSRRDGGQLLGDSKPMRDLRAQIDKIAPLELPVLVLGETGVGKELVARALHDRSARHRGPFVAENCSALPSELMERELFGHVQGAFTGADRDRPGLLELANGGTLFLDEVGDMPPALQSKLLRALQERSIRRVGGSETIALDLRLLAATHKDLRAMVQAGTFREDLFFRLAAVELLVPPLRDRGDDVVMLAENFMRRHAGARGMALRLSGPAKAALRGHRWPGNVRELEHVVARAALTCEGDEIFDLGLPVDPGDAGSVGSAGGGGEALVVPVRTLKEVERLTIVAALQACGGDKAKTARALGISRTALYEKLKRFGST